MPDNLPEPVVRKLVPTGVITEFGEALIDEDLERQYGMGADRTYVPGWSEIVMERDRQVVESSEGKRPRSAIRTLPGNLRWTKVKQASGAPDETKLQESRMNGYEPVLASKAGKVEWLTRMPDGAFKTADGFIQKGDCVLTYASAERAAQNKYRKMQRTQDRLGASIEKAEGFGIATDSHQGDAVTIGSQIKDRSPA